MAHQEEEPLIPYGSEISMALFMLTIPLMVLAVAITVLPLIMMSFADRHRTAETISTAAALQSQPAIADDEDVPQAA